MEDTTEDPDESSSGTVSEAHSNDESSESSNTGEGVARSQKQRLHPTKGTARGTLPNIMNKVQSVLEENSEAKKKGRKRTILVFYYRQNGKKKQNQERKKKQAAERSQSSDSDSTLTGSSQETTPSAFSLPKRIRKWFFQ